MSMSSSAETKTSTASRRNAVINLRLPEREKDLIDAAAATIGKTRTEFVLDSAKQRATDILLDRRMLELDEAGWAAFNAALEAPPPPNAALRKLMARKAPWET
jgi:uncharacterized protein (DUF1778 family)